MVDHDAIIEGITHTLGTFPFLTHELVAIAREVDRAKDPMRHTPLSMDSAVANLRMLARNAAAIAEHLDKLATILEDET